MTDPLQYQTSYIEKFGVVYLIEDLERPGLFRIGQTERLRGRLRNHAKKNRIRLVWFIATNQSVWLERYLMAQWKETRSHGDWFWVPSNWVESFKSICVLNWKKFEPVELEARDFNNGNFHRASRFVMEIGEEVRRVSPR